MILEVGQARSFPRYSADSEPATPCKQEHQTNKSYFLDLPFELRNYILTLVLRQTGTIELQHPLWAGLQVFAQPLFKVNRSVRDEALDAFYEVNDFLWVIDTEHRMRSDPARYPEATNSIPNGKFNGGNIRPEIGSPLTPVFPWEFPRLWKCLRRLQVNVYLPHGKCAFALQESLRDLVRVLDRGRRLAAFHLLVTTKGSVSRNSWDVGACCEALEVLADMVVRGSVEVQTRHYPIEIRRGVWNLNLSRRMKRV